MPRLLQVLEVQKGQGEVLFGTASAQQQIHQRQHPVDCSKHRFLVHKPQVSGIGSMLHQVI